ncbi:glycosyltransferase family 2 protein [Fulvivirga sp. 29W222]|uniref:Glycosyltransferase family 2 protein n=1 Tax=Fulvivirga marina TaxID=2494733 RepID=A0A937G1U8_9BACT|nr:cellulose synthase family protein [Fulvivirga marina]MBL6446936.1 glycosyltransferase family 2 protein [Fulvivirga marina]
MEYFVVVIYGLSLLLIFLFSLGQLHLTWHYLKARKKNKSVVKPLQVYPKVTVQLPVYNERYVIQRLIDAVCQFQYPKDKFEVQILDDSTDETVEIITGKVLEWKQEGVDIKHIQREDRKGFKAGALQYGLGISEGEFIAIFDADFLPQSDFLMKTLPVFENTTGVVQTRWGHLNKDYSMLTRLQAFGLDAHFSIEQTGRNHAGSFINFNGTGGVWRKNCIYDAGGWSADTLTEDLDLSYRAQMKGWKFKYLEDYVAPAELPVIMPAIKSQQYRWNKGAAETARKNLWKVFSSPIKGMGKIHAFFHLFNSSVFVCLLLASILSIPMLFIKEAHPGFDFIFDLGSIFLIGFLSIAFFYWVASKQSHPRGTGKYYLTTFPVFLTVSMGLSLHNGIAVLEGLLGIKSPFIRTPKFNIKNKADTWKGNIYVKPKIDFVTIMEGLLSLYFMFGIASGIYLHDLGLMIFHVMLSLGFASVFYYSIKPLKHG